MALWKDESPREQAPRTEPPKAPEKVAVLSAVSESALHRSTAFLRPWTLIALQSRIASR